MAKDTALRDSLSQVDLFQGLSKKELDHVVGAGRVVDFAADEVLMQEGAEGGRFHLILEGRVSVKVNGQSVQELGPGEYLGEISLIDGQPRMATVVADTRVKTFSLAQFTFRPLLREIPAMTEKLLVNLCHRLRLERDAHS